jgi:hypothetical protein
LVCLGIHRQQLTRQRLGVFGNSQTIINKTASWCV